MNAHSRRIIGWAIDETMTAGLVEDALAMACTLREDLPDKVISHSDKGTQYAFGQMRKWTKEHGVARSMGATGVAWDNAMAESFFATLKIEFYYRRTWPTKRAALQGVARWIEETCNRRRRHSSLGQLDPVSYEIQQFNYQPLNQQATQKAPTKRGQAQTSQQSSLPPIAHELVSVRRASANRDDGLQAICRGKGRDPSQPPKSQRIVGSIAGFAPKEGA